jgi:hypothetical protein
MMYRSGWAQKENQNRILAVEITLEGFSQLLEAGIVSSYDAQYGSHEQWKQQLDQSDVRIQWDPDHGIHGEKLIRRAVQIGIRDAALQRFNEEYIRSIEDITPFVLEQYRRLQQNREALEVVQEEVIAVNETIRSKYAIPFTTL